MPHPYRISARALRDLLERVVSAEPTWAIVLRDTDELVGMTSLVPHPEQHSAELG